MGRAARADRGDPRGPAARGVGPRRPRRRLPAERPRDASPRSSPRRRWARCGPPRRRSSARAASSTASARSSRRCCWRSTATATAARTSTAARPSTRSREEIGAPVVRLGYLDGSGWEDGFLGDDAARVRAGPVRPPALGALLLRHDRAAQGDRPGPGRDPARAAEDGAPAPGRRAGRPRVLVHDDRLDDVELPRRRAADRRGDRALRRQPGHAGPGPAVGPRRGRRGSRASAPARATSRRA